LWLGRTSAVALYNLGAGLDEKTLASLQVGMRSGHFKADISFVDSQVRRCFLATYEYDIGHQDTISKLSDFDRSALSHGRMLLLRIPWMKGDAALGSLSLADTGMKGTFNADIWLLMNMGTYLLPSCPVERKRECISPLLCHYLLASLDLSRNELSGKLTDEFDSLPKLKDLVLEDNVFEGKVMAFYRTWIQNYYVSTERGVAVRKP
jgi:hypothetical protein